MSVIYTTAWSQHLLTGKLLSSVKCDLPFLMSPEHLVVELAGEYSIFMYISTGFWYIENIHKQFHDNLKVYYMFVTNDQFHSI